MRRPGAPGAAAAAARGDMSDITGTIAIVDAVQCTHPPRPSTLDRILPRTRHRGDGSEVLIRHGLNHTADPLYPVLPQYLPRIERTLFERDWLATMVLGAALGVVGLASLLRARLERRARLEADERSRPHAHAV